MFFGELSSPLREAFPSPARPARPVQQFSLGNFAQTTIGMSPNSTLNDMKTSSARALMVQLLAFVLLALGNPAKLGAVTVTLTPPAVTSGWAGSTFSGVFDVTLQDYYKYSYTVTATVGGVGSSGASASVSMWWGNSYTITTDVAGRGDVIVTVTVDGTPLPGAGPLANDTASASATVTIAGIDSISPATEYALTGTTLTFTAAIDPPGTSVQFPAWGTTGGGTITALTPNFGLSAIFVADASIIGSGAVTISATGAATKTATVQEITLSFTAEGPALEGSPSSSTFELVVGNEPPSGITYAWDFLESTLVPAETYNSPAIPFTDATQKLTDLSGLPRWFERDGNRLMTAVNDTCSYSVYCRVSYKSGIQDSPISPWEVYLPRTMGRTPWYGIRGFPRVESYMAGTETRYRFLDIGIDPNTMMRVPVSVPDYFILTTSQFYAKTVVHENKHVEQTTRPEFTSFIDPWNVLVSIIDTDTDDLTTLSPILAAAKADANAAHRAYKESRDPTLEEEAYTADKAVIPHFFEGL